MKLTLLKWGLGSPPGLPKLQSSIAGGQKIRIGAFFISLENYQNVDVENGLAWAIWTSAAQVMAKRKVGSQTTILTLDHEKSKINPTWPRCVQGECDTPLKSSQQELQLCFKPRPNWRSKQKIIVPQSCGSPNRGSFETPPWESWDKKPLGYGCRGEA